MRLSHETNHQHEGGTDYWKYIQGDNKRGDIRLQIGKYILIITGALSSSYQAPTPLFAKAL